MKLICEKEKCSGCCACLNSCPVSCISMKSDKYGVLLPTVDEEKCINCGACERVCPANHPQKLKKGIKAYAAWHNEAELRKKSASGGASRALYELILERKGVCYGVSFDEDLRLTFKAAQTEEEVSRFRGSKYVQAYVGMIMRDVKANLQKGKEVVFVGTPCQVAGLKSYLGKEYTNLITVDLICHGVPSQDYLKVHVNEIEKRIKEKADDISFRGEYSFELTLYKAKKVIYQKYRFLDSYFTGFLNGLFYRISCYQCPYACENRVGDITIGDFWGLGKEVPCKYSIGDGTSVLIPNTEKGVQIINHLKNKMFIDERPLSEAINGNSQLRHPSEMNSNYELFRQLYLEKGFEKAAQECTKNDIARWKKENRKNKIKRNIKKIVKIVIRRK